MVNSVGLVFIVNHMHFGGCQKIVYDLITGIDKKFENVYLIAKKGYYSDLLKEKKTVNFCEREKSFFKNYKLIQKIQKKHSKIIIHTHNRIDIIYKYALNKKSNHIHTFHSAYINKNYLYKFIKPQISVSISKTVKSYLDSYGIDNIMIYNGVELSSQEYNNREKSNIPKILYIGRITEQKGFDNLLKGLLSFSTKYSEFSKIQLDVIGDGKKIDYYKNLVSNSESQLRVIFKGFVSNPWANLNTYDILVIPSYFEGFCLVAAEGASIGVPIIGNDILALREVLDFLPDSNFFDIHNEYSIHETILINLKNLKKNNDLARKNIDLIRNRYSKEMMILKYINVYESII